MLSRSYTSISNWLLFGAALALFALPFGLGERALVPLYSSQQLQMQVVNFYRDRGLGRRLLFLGDSTIRNLQPRESEFDRDPAVTNLGAGGAMVAEWYYILRNALEVSDTYREIVVGMANGESLQTTDLMHPYYPFLLRLPDIWLEFKAGRMTFEQAVSQAHYVLSKFLYTKGDILYQLVSGMVPALRQYMLEVYLRQVENSGKRNAEESARRLNPLASPNWAIPAFLDLAKAHGASVLFLLSPVSSSTRASAAYPQRRAVFHEHCERYSLRCVDLSDRLSDDHFGEDGIHLRQESVEKYRDLIGRQLSAGGRP